MAHWSLVTYTRPNSLTNWFTPSDEVLAKIEEFKTANKILTYEKSTSADTLKQYYKIQFSNTDASAEFADLPECVENYTVRQTYCTNNGITINTEQFGDSEPIV